MTEPGVFANLFGVGHLSIDDIRVYGFQDTQVDVGRVVSQSTELHHVDEEARPGSRIVCHTY